MTPTPELTRARVTQLAEWSEQGLRMADMAAKLGYKTTGGLTHWVRRHAPEYIQKMLRESCHQGPRPIPRAEVIRRLQIAKGLEDQGINISSFAQWVRRFAPDGAADALDDYAEEV